MRQALGWVGVLSVVLSCVPAKGPVVPARLELVPAALLLPAPGATSRLEVRAFDAEGNRVSAPELTFASSGSAVSVSGDGTVEATAANGTSRVTVTAGGLSASTTVLVAAPIDGAVLVSDDQVVGALRPVIPGAPAAVGSRYEVTLQGVTPPAPGGLVIGTGARPVGGRVVAVAGDAVTLELVPLDELFQDLRLDEQLDLKEAPLALDPAVRAAFDVVETPEGGVTLTLKQPLEGSNYRKVRAPIDGKIEFDLGPMACAVEASAFQLSLLKLDISLDPGLSVERVFDPVHKRAVVKSNAKAGVTVKPLLQSQLEGKLTCELNIGERYVPLPGPVGLVLGFTVPFGVGFEVEAKAPILGNVSAEFKREVTATAVAGVDCNPGCSPVGDFANTSAPATGGAAPTLALALPTNFKMEAGLYVFAFAKLQFGGSEIVSAIGGVTGFRRIEADLAVAKAGLKVEGRFADEEAQAGDPAFSGDYRVLFEAGLEPGAALESFFGFIKVTVVKLELKFIQELGTSPKGTLTVDKATFVPGDDLSFTAKFTPASLQFPLVGFNAVKVRLYQKGGSGPNPSLVLVAEAPMQEGQSEVTMTGVATTTGTSADFVAFVRTAFLDALSCELASGAPNVAPEVVLSLAGGTSPFISCMNERRILSYDCAEDNSIRAEVNECRPTDVPLPNSPISIGTSQILLTSPSPGVYTFGFSTTLPAPLIGTCTGSNPHSYDEPSTLSAGLMVLVSPLEAGSFTVEGLSPASIFSFPTRTALDQGQVTIAPALAAPAVNSFDAGTAFAIRVQLQYTGDGTPVTNRPFATVTFSK